MIADGFYNAVFGCPFCEENKNKVSACFYCKKSLTNSENPSSNPLQEACFDFQVQPTVTLKVVPQAGYDMYMHCRKFTNDREGKPEQNEQKLCIDAAFETVFKISKYFQKKQQKLLSIFLFKKVASQFQIHLSLYRTYGTHCNQALNQLLHIF